MRVSKAQAAENRDRILNAAATLIRKRGIQGVGVDALAEAAGLTHGSLYSQFGSKDRLAAEALHVALLQNAERFAEAGDLKGYVAQYLSPTHRDLPGQGCALATLGCEMPRSSNAVRNEFTAGVRRMVDRIAGLIGGAKQRREDVALAAVATMVGGILLSRAVDDPDLADRILQAAASSLLPPHERDEIVADRKAPAS